MNRSHAFRKDRSNVTKAMERSTGKNVRYIWDPSLWSLADIQERRKAEKDAALHHPHEQHNRILTKSEVLKHYKNTRNTIPDRLAFRDLWDTTVFLLVIY